MCYCRSFSVKKDFAALVRSLPLDVMMPVNTGLTLTLPTSGCTERQHQPFAEVVTIADIKDEVELLPSLQKPKKVRLPKEQHCFESRWILLLLPCTCHSHHEAREALILCLLSSYSKV